MNRKMKLLYILALAIGMLVMGCSTSKNGFPDNQKLNVVTSFYTMSDFAAKIGGDKVNIINLVPSGMEPHDFEPKTGDITKLKNAKVFIYNGAAMENWVDKVVSSSNNKDLVTVEASREVKLLSESGAIKDPHVWLNPQNAIIEMAAIEDAFVKADPNNKSYYEQNFDTYKNRLNELDKEYKEAVATFNSKDIVVAHAAFGYLCDAYGLKQVPIEGLNAESEPTAAKMAEISKYAKDNNIKVIFFEELVSPKVAQTIAKEAGAKTDKLNPLEGISDEDKKNNKEYISIMQDNLDALKRALN